MLTFVPMDLPLKATFRTLAAAQYFRVSRAGHGILLTVGNSLIRSTSLPNSHG
jgi:hypothetical protein